MNMKKLAVLVLAAALTPISGALAAPKEGKKPAVDCQKQARDNCPSYGTSGQACFRAAFARCKSGK